MSDDWDVEDSWVLAAIATRGRRCTLTEVVAAADWINHAILLENEVESALGKLTGADLVRVFEDWTFELTDLGLSLWSAEVRSLAEQRAFIEAHLAGIEPGTTTVQLPPGALDAAVNQHLRGAARA